MATTVSTIEVPLPEGAHVTPEEVEALRSLFRAIAGLRFDERRHGSRVRRALERGGWNVSCGLQWHVEVRRGRELEQACGSTPDEAFTAVWRAAGTGEPLEGTP
jgi:hypothetical protein